jgi:hypothetical protein
MRDYDRDRRREWFGDVGLFWALDARWFERPDAFDAAPPSSRYRTQPPVPVKPTRWSTFVTWILRRAKRASLV